ncbi:type II toxin-antitoxin system RelE/ParE family toxin [Castellaniella sp. MT123]|uniref:type II toxin-antitoxin system RelE/ParE family toxin n=1 Tax=Castellaniella sp. MT123 TaxID=3140381 RepID=UPI0031F3EA6E
MKAVLLDEAQTDIRELRQYITQVFDKATWQGTYAGIKTTVRNTAAFPLSGHIPPELAELGLSQYRQTLSGMNRIVYEVQGDMLYIHIVCDTRKDLRALLTRRLLKR